MPNTKLATHVDYPHEDGRLYDCPGCEAACHCAPNTACCIYAGQHRHIPENQRFFARHAYDWAIQWHDHTIATRYAQHCAVAYDQPDGPTFLEWWDHTREFANFLVGRAPS